MQVAAILSSIAGSTTAAPLRCLGAAQGHVAAKPAFEQLLGQARAQLHPMHVAAIDCLMPLVNCSRAVGDQAQAIRHLQQLLSALEAVYGCHTVEVR